MEFKDFSTPKQIKDYLLKVLSRTGGKNSNEVYIYHYSNMNAIHNMINGGYIWLSSPNSMIVSNLVRNFIPEKSLKSIMQR